MARSSGSSDDRMFPTESARLRRASAARSRSATSASSSSGKSRSLTAKQHGTIQADEQSAELMDFACQESSFWVDSSSLVEAEVQQ